MVRKSRNEEGNVPAQRGEDVGGTWLNSEMKGVRTRTMGPLRIAAVEQSPAMNHDFGPAFWGVGEGLQACVSGQQTCLP